LPISAENTIFVTGNDIRLKITERTQRNNKSLFAMEKKLIRVLAVILLHSFMVISAQAVEVSETLAEQKKAGSAKIYTFNYPSKNVAGEDIVLSSMLIAWSPDAPKDNDSIESVHIYGHFTITAGYECPTSERSTEQMLFTAFCRQSYSLFDSSMNHVTRNVIICPDFEGYGVTNDLPHPYLAQDLTAQQVLDGVKYGLQLYKKLVDEKKALPIKSDWRTYAFGFSQGGSVALAVQRYIEQHQLADELHFRGSICGDGPYDPIATLRYYLDDDGNSYGTQTTHKKGTTNMPMVIPMIIKGMIISHPDMKSHQPEDYLSQQFLDTGIMDWLASKEFSTDDIHKKWFRQLTEGLEANGRSYTKEQMAELFAAIDDSEEMVLARLDKLFTPEFYKYLTNEENFTSIPTEKGNALKDIHRAMADNSLTTGWEPEHRIQFVHSKGDVVVPYCNYLAFRDAHPDGENTLYRVDTNLSPRDHVDVGQLFYINLTTGLGNFNQFYTWLDESPSPSAINGLTIDHNDHSWYTIHGQRLTAKPTRAGIYIHHGKKYMIK